MTQPSEPERFFKSLAQDFDTAALLRWSFLVEGATEYQIEPLIGAVGEMGFTEVEPLADEDQVGRYKLWFAEVCVHSAGSFAARVAAVEQLAAHEGLIVSDFSTGHVE